MSNLICPVCNTADIVETEKTFKCVNNHYPPQPGDCTFVLWKDSLKAFGKTKISIAELVKLAGGKRITLKLKSKAGKPYECEGELDQIPGKTYHSVKLIFADRAAGKPVAIPASKSIAESDSDDETDNYEEETLEDC